jgi:hypothetical protein
MTDDELDRRIAANQGNYLDVLEQQKRRAEKLQRLVDTLVEGQSKLTVSVDRLQNARKIDKAILIATLAGVLVGLFGIGAAFLLSGKSSISPSHSPATQRP